MTDRNAQAAISEDDIAYVDAVSELEQILQRIEVADIDVDTLSNQVERAAHLLKICRTRIGRAETRIKDVLADMEEDSPWQANSSVESDVD